MTTQPQVAATIDDNRLLRRVKIGILIMLVIFGAQLLAKTEYWPITRWAMYRSAGRPPTTYNDFAIWVTTGPGERHVLHVPDLGFIARNIIIGAIENEDPDARTAYRNLLTERVERALATSTIAKIEIQQQTWQVEEWEVPPFDRDNPIQSVWLAEFLVAQRPVDAESEGP